MKTPENIKRMIRERAKVMAFLSKPRKSTSSFRAIADLMKRAKECMGKGHPEESKRLRDEAEVLALENLRQRTILHHLEGVKTGTMKDELRRLIDHCERLLESMDGKQVKPKDETHQQGDPTGDAIFRVLDAVQEYRMLHGRSPTHTELKKFVPSFGKNSDGKKLRGERISEVSSYLKELGSEILEKDKPGPKSN